MASSDSGLRAVYLIDGGCPWRQPPSGLSAALFRASSRAFCLFFSFVFVFACPAALAGEAASAGYAYVSQHEFCQGAGSVIPASYPADSSCDPLKHLNVKCWTTTQPERATVVCVHALGLAAHGFRDFATVMADRGISTCAIDVRGFGPGRDQAGHRKLDLDASEEDVSALILRLRKLNPAQKIFLVGESMGGALALRVASEHPGLVDGVICSAPAWKILKFNRIVARGLLDLCLFHPTLAPRSVMGQATTSEELKSHWKSDPSHKLELSVREAYKYMRFMQKTPLVASRVKGIPVLVIQGLNDRLSSPTASVELFRRMPTRQKELLLVGSGEHLVLEEGQLTSTVGGAVLGWIQDHMGLHSSRRAIPSVVVMESDTLSEKELDRVDRLIRASGARRRQLTARK